MRSEIITSSPVKRAVQEFIASLSSQSTRTSQSAPLRGFIFKQRKSLVGQN